MEVRVLRGGGGRRTTHRTARAAAGEGGYPWGERSEAGQRRAALLPPYQKYRGSFSTETFLAMGLPSFKT